MSIDFGEAIPDADRFAENLLALSKITEPDEEGWTRQVFSEAYRQSREWVVERMTEAGLEVTADGAGNVVGTLHGSRNGAAIVTGSHTDTVRGGGRFDGIVGVLGAIEVVHLIRERGIRLVHDLRVVDFLGEEPNEFGISCVGSRAVTGHLDRAILSLTRADDDPRDRLADALLAFGADPSEVLRSGWRADDIAGFVELHIEQGPVLEREGIEIGVVTGIAGIERLLAEFIGRPDHAGTMPMNERRDALAAAAECVLAVERAGCSGGPDAVSTTGRLAISPGAVNVVPGSARMSAEVRSIDADWLRGVKKRLAEEIAEVAARRGVAVDLEWLNDQPPVPTTPRTRDVIAAAADKLGFSWMPIASGAGHDAAHLASLGPVGMIFVPSHGGRSHCPEEWTDFPSILAGVQTLGQTLVDLDITSII